MKTIDKTILRIEQEIKERKENFDQKEIIDINTIKLNKPIKRKNTISQKRKSDGRIQDYLVSLNTSFQRINLLREEINKVNKDKVENSYNLTNHLKAIIYENIDYIHTLINLIKNELLIKIE